MSKLSDVVKNDVVKKAVYDNSAAIVNNTNTSVFVWKIKYQTDKTELEKKIHDVSNLVKKAKLTELEKKNPNISSLATKSALTGVKNKIPSVSSLVRKTDYDTKLTEISKKTYWSNHGKYITTSGLNAFAVNVLD